jgi:hypothetical protein
MQKSLALVRGFFVFGSRLYPCLCVAASSFALPHLHLRRRLSIFSHANSLMPFGQLSLVRRGAYPFSF